MLDDDATTMEGCKRHIFSAFCFWGGWTLFFTGLVLCSLCYFILFFHPVSDGPCMPPPLNSAPDAKSFRVAFFGDNDMYKKPLDVLSADMDRKKVDFILCGGDFVHPATDAMIALAANDFKKIFHVPVYATPGNHDVRNHECQQSFTSIFGPPENCFVYGDTLFILLESAKLTVSEAQLKWLDFVLNTERPKHRRCVIMTHVPPVALAPFDKRKYRWDEETAEKFRKIIENKHVDLILCGHVHCAMEIPFGDTKIIVTPSSGQGVRDPNDSRYGYIFLNFKEDGTISNETVRLQCDRGSRPIQYFIFRRLNQRAIMFSMGLFCLLLSPMAIAFGAGRRHRPTPPINQ